MIVDMILRSKLPWHSETQVDVVLEMKQTALNDPTKLFPEKEISELRYIVSYLAKLHYVDKIDYDWMVTMIKRVAKRKRCSLKLHLFD
ncbi:unnamed protein product [Meloidogyne enterolobii]|uniref:Uncharacterized protein n=1 Tax=Meloidogyne enterolobii TaxID=390850 RepID=A0ACB0YKW0_MELEN